MTAGNVGALRQNDGVALLAWSSIAQAGFMLAPALAGDPVLGINAAAQYLAVYALANIVGFMALAVVLQGAWLDILRRPRRLGANRPVGRRPAGVRRARRWLGSRRRLSGWSRSTSSSFQSSAGGWTWVAVVMAVNVMLGLAYYLRFVATLFAPAETDDRSAASADPPACGWRRSS